METQTERERWAARLRALIDHRGWTGRELARRAELSPSLVASVLRGEAENLSDKSKRAVAKTLWNGDWDAMVGSERLEPPALAEPQNVTEARQLIARALALLTQANSPRGAMAAPGFLDRVLTPA